MIRRLAVPALAVLSAAVLSACGQAPGAGSRAGDLAAEMPANTLVYAELELDQRSHAWQNAERLGSRFPGWSKLVAQVQRGLAKSNDGFSVAKNALPSLGTRASVAMTGVRFDGAKPEESYVVYLAVRDGVSLERIMATPEAHLKHTGSYGGFQEYRTTLGERAVVATSDDTFLLASDRASLRDAIDAHDGDAPTLAGKESFRAAMARLPKGALLRGYVDVDGIRPLLALAQRFGTGRGSGTYGPGVESSAQLAQLRRALAPLHAVSFSVGAERTGFRAAAVMLGDASKLAPGAGPVTPLIDRVPADALVYAGGTQAEGDAGLKTAVDAAGVKEFRATTGIDPVRDLVPLFDGQFAGYAAPGAPVSAALLLQPKDAGAAAAALRRIAAQLAQREPGARVVDTASGQRVRLGPDLTISWRRDGDVIGVGNDRSAPATRTPDVTEQADLQRVLREAGVDDGARGLVYVDVPAVVQVLGGEQPGVRPLGPLVGWTTTAPGATTSQLFLEIR